MTNEACKRFKDWKHPVFDKKDMTRWNWMCQHSGNLKLGCCVDIGAFTYINAEYNVSIGKYAQIGSHCSIYSHDSEGDVRGCVIIGKDVKIGCHTSIMPGVVIGDGAEVYAHSFVKHHTRIGKNEKWAGIPAKKVR